MVFGLGSARAAAEWGVANRALDMAVPTKDKQGRERNWTVNKPNGRSVLSVNENWAAHTALDDFRKVYEWEEGHTLLPSTLYALHDQVKGGNYTAVEHLAHGLAAKVQGLTSTERGVMMGAVRTEGERIKEHITPDPPIKNSH